MITRQNKKRFAKFRILLSLPVLAGLLICFSFTEQTARTDSAIEQSTTTETIAASVAEINNISEINAANESKPQEQQEAPFLRVQQMPTFEGGDLQSFRNWAMQKLIYPENAKKNGIQGKVVASFIIEKDGSLSSIKIENDPDKLLADEIIRVLKQSPKWTPGTQRGEKVRVKYSMPFDFKVN